MVSNILKNSSLIAYFVGILPMMLYVVLYIMQFENLFFRMDEFRVIFEFLLKAKQGLTISALFHTDNEHINVTARMIAYLNYLVFGEFHFYSLYAFGLISYTFFCGLLMRTYIQVDTSIAVKSIALLFMFFFGYYSLTSFSLVGVQYFTTSAFALSAFVLSSRSVERWKLALSFLCCVLATFTFGNGILSFAVVAFILWKKESKKAAIWFGVSFLLMVIMYLSLSSSSQPQTHLFGNIYVMIRYFIHLTGLLWNQDYMYATAVVGVIAVVMYVFVLFRIFKDRKWNDIVVEAVFLYFLLSMLTIVLSRHAKGVEDVFKLRYSFYSLMCLSAGSFLFFKKVSWRDIYKQGVLLVVVLLYFNSFFIRYHAFFNWKKDSMEVVEIYKATGKIVWNPVNRTSYESEKASNIMHAVEQESVYQFPTGD